MRQRPDYRLELHVVIYLCHQQVPEVGLRYNILNHDYCQGDIWTTSETQILYKSKYSSMDEDSQEISPPDRGADPTKSIPPDVDSLPTDADPLLADVDPEPETAVAACEDSSTSDNKERKRLKLKRGCHHLLPFLDGRRFWNNKGVVSFMYHEGGGAMSVIVENWEKKELLGYLLTSDHYG
ncbi:hypothetical protein R1flu_021564 [Riccia fluitans]|uniref:Uncharacterized protein n=1 Tax=Riccia fluitans TaxID=41844 RepID=A0ABD1ZRP8_9MARC